MDWWNRVDLKRRLGKTYSDFAFLGHGQNGAVFRARRKSDRQLVAVKFVRLTRSDALTRSRLNTEIEATRRLAGDGAVRIYESNTKATPPFYVMEYLKLGDFSKFLKKRTTSTACALEEFVRICDCVAKCHEANITHRDLKPENILFRKLGQPVLSDFGICKIGQMPQGTTAIEMQRRGTPLYMAPEQFTDTLKQSKPADIHALGTILHFDIAKKAGEKEIGREIEGLGDRCRVANPNGRITIDDLKKGVIQIRDSVERRLASRTELHRIGLMTDAVIRRAAKIDSSLLFTEARHLHELMQKFNREAAKEREFAISYQKWSWRDPDFENSSLNASMKNEIITLTQG